MDQTQFDELKQALQTEGADKAIDRLCAQLREGKDYAGLFYALLMKKRHELGVLPIPTGPASDLPARVHEPYEHAIREAGRLVGRLFLEAGNISQAFHYFRMLGEPEPVAAALENYTLEEGEDAQPIIELAFHHGANPRKGFEWILSRFGICSAITILGGSLNGGNFPHGPEARDHCLKTLAKALHEQLVQRIKYDITRREGKAPQTNSITELIAGRDWLFEEDNYHVDVSHLSSVVQMGLHLSKCPELELLRELCAYGKHLAVQYRGQADPPFEDTYKDHGIFYDILAGVGVEEGLAHFRAKAENPNPDYAVNFAAEHLVNLYLRLNRSVDALATARRFLVNADERQLSCPSIGELCQQLKDYGTLAEVARERNDPVHFVAGLLAASKPST